MQIRRRLLAASVPTRAKSSEHTNDSRSGHSSQRVRATMPKRSSSRTSLMSEVDAVKKCPMRFGQSLCCRRTPTTRTTWWWRNLMTGKHFPWNARSWRAALHHHANSEEDVEAPKGIAADVTPSSQVVWSCEEANECREQCLAPAAEINTSRTDRQRRRNMWLRVVSLTSCHLAAMMQMPRYR